MAASDTVVGILGSILLVGVMVGVFVYEYNNAPDADGGDEATRQAFMDAHPNLDPDGDLDGDGLANHADNDLDGDGIPNAEDDSTERVLTFSGTTQISVAATGDVVRTVNFDALEGVVFVEVEFQASGQIPAGATSDLSLDITDPDGASQTIGPDNGHGSNGPAGSWELVVRNNSAAVLSSYEITVTLTY